MYFNIRRSLTFLLSRQKVEQVDLQLREELLESPICSSVTQTHLTGRPSNLQQLGISRIPNPYMHLHVHVRASTLCISLRGPCAS